MGFDPKYADIVMVRARWRCEACGVPVYWAKGEPRLGMAHSANTLHLVLDPDRSDRYIVTSTPYNHRNMLNKRLPVFGFRVWALGRPDDGFCLCLLCHLKVHALADSKMPGGRNAIPNVLEEVTIMFVATRGKMTF